jgi:hypothetical protein
MQIHLLVGGVRVLVDVVDTVRVEQGGAALDTVDDVALLQQKLSQVGAVLPSNTRDQRYFAHLETFLRIKNILWGLFLELMKKNSPNSRTIVVPATHDHDCIAFNGVHQPMCVIYTP